MCYGHRYVLWDVDVMIVEGKGVIYTLTTCYTRTRYSGLLAITDDPLCFWYLTANFISYTGQICKPDRTEIPPTEKNNIHRELISYTG